MSLPSGYIQLSYIESTGTQYIDTGYKLKTTDKVEIDYQLTQASDENHRNRLFGSQNSSSSYRFIVAYTSGTTAQSTFYLGAGYSTFNNSYATDLTRHMLKVDSGELYIDGTQEASRTQSFTSTYNCYLCGYNSANTPYVLSFMKCYSFKITNSSNVVQRDMIPALQLSTGSVGMYDQQNNVFYSNSGTGVFTGQIENVDAERKLKVECFYPTGIVNGWDYNSKSLFDSWERLSNISIVKQDEDTNSVYVYNNDGTTLRGAYTIQNDGTIVQISGAVANRLGSNKTKFIYDTDNVVLDLVKNELPSLQYNHKITFNINFGGEYGFNDFNLGMPIKFYSTDDNHLYDSCLSAWEYSIKENSDDILSAKFTLGKVRSSLTSKLNKKND